MGVVFQALDRRLKRPVAIKFLRTAGNDDQDRARFAREARLYGRLSHPHLVRVYDADPNATIPYLVMELVDGRDLVRSRATGTAVDALALGRALASALAYIHGEGILHRDLKPANILLAGGRPLLTDFGLAREFAPDATNITASGLVVGTVGYMAPELILGQPHSRASDVYALALTLYECAGGTLVFKAGSGPGLTMEARMAGKVPRLSDSGVRVPPALDDLLVGALTHDPARRPDAERFASDLEGVGRRTGPRRAGKSGPTPRVPLSSTATPLPNPRRTVAGLASLTVLGLIGLAFVTKFKERTPEPPPAAAAPSDGTDAATLRRQVQLSSEVADRVYAHELERWRSTYRNRADAVYQQAGAVDRLRATRATEVLDLEDMRRLIARWNQVRGALPIPALAARLRARTVTFLCEVAVERTDAEIVISQQHTGDDSPLPMVPGLADLSKLGYKAQALADFEACCADLGELFDAVASAPEIPAEIVDAFHHFWDMCQAYRAVFFSPKWSPPFCRAFERLRARVAALRAPLGPAVERVVVAYWYTAWNGCEDRKSPTLSSVRADIEALAALAPAHRQGFEDLIRELEARMGH